MNTPNSEQKPTLIDSLFRVLKSRRVIVAVVTVIVSLIVSSMPEVASYANDILTVLVVLALALIGGFSLEDAARVARGSTLPESDLQTLIRAVLVAVLDELAGDESGEDT